MRHNHSEFNRPLRRAAIALFATAGLFAALAGGSTTGQSFDTLARDVVTTACGTDNPYIAIVCTDRVAAFQDSPGDRPHYTFGFPHGAREGTVGAIWGLAYSSREHALYAAATHRRGYPFGAGGPGAIYRIDMLTGAISQPITVPNAGGDHHSVDVRGSDTSGRDVAGRTSLGDIDLSDDARELFAVNLDDRRIYRFNVATGALIGAFDTGGTLETWADDARPFGLAYSAAVLYHVVVNSAESSQDKNDLLATVFASQADGSDMRALYSTRLDQLRSPVSLQNGRPSTEWQPWIPVGVRQHSEVFPQPIAADITFTDGGSLIIGLKDRWGDMSLNRVGRPDLEGVGQALGDVLSAPALGTGWGAAQAFAAPWLPPFQGVRRNWPQGGVATVRGEIVATGSIGSDNDSVWSESVNWFNAADGERSRVERACTPVQGTLLTVSGRRVVRAAPLQDNERMPETFNFSSPPGDVELLCPPTARPTATLSPTPFVSPTPSSTRTATMTRTVTPTATDTPRPSATPSPTREPSPIYLPITLTEPRCLPIHPKLDIILVLDASTSMRELTRAGRPKIDAAVAAARDFLTRLSLAPDGDHAGLVSFNAAATLDSSLTADRTALDVALGRVALAQFTRIDLGLDAAAAELAGPRRRADATAAVILLTDGRSNPVPVSEAERAAGVVKAAGARLFTIGLGQDVDAEALRAMASQAADYFEAPDGEDLGAIYGAISAALPCAPYSYWP